MVKHDDSRLKCSFCGKTQDQVKKLIAGPEVYICDECVELCNEILDEEFFENKDKEKGEGAEKSPTDLTNIPKSRHISTKTSSDRMTQKKCCQSLFTTIINVLRIMQKAMIQVLKSKKVIFCWLGLPVPEKRSLRKRWQKCLMCPLRLLTRLRSQKQAMWVMMLKISS